MASCYLRFGAAKPAMLQLMFGSAIPRAPRESSVREAARGALMELLRAAAAAEIPLDSHDRLQLAIAGWSLVHGYRLLRIEGALDFAGRRDGINPLVRCIELDWRR
jgi:hypothetical protein